MFTGTKEQYLAVLERAIKQAAYTVLTLIGTNQVGITDIDWVNVANVAALSAVVSVVGSFASWKVGGVEGPSLGPEAPKDQVVVVREGDQ